MYVTTHALLGAAAAATLPGPGVGFLGGVMSHAVADMIPHNDYQKGWHGALDLVTAAAILSFLVGVTGAPHIMIGAVGGAIPDLEVAIWYLSGGRWKHSIFPTHAGLLPHGKTRFGLGFLIQTALALLAVAIIALAL